ncbi:MAG: hypothetical protein GY915_07995 [bacterium]|nr:hypothetical protein [bacterium]
MTPKIICAFFALSLAPLSQTFSSTQEDEGDLNRKLVRYMKNNADLARKNYLKVVRYGNEGSADDILDKTVQGFNLTEEYWTEILYNSVKPVTIHYYGEPQYPNLGFQNFSKGAKKAFINFTSKIFKDLNKWVKEDQLRRAQKYVRSSSPLRRDYASYDSGHWSYSKDQR